MKGSSPLLGSSPGRHRSLGLEHGAAEQRVEADEAEHNEASQLNSVLGRPSRMPRVSQTGCLAVLASTALLACAPVNPSEASLVGQWRVSWKCGVEVLELHGD